MDNSSELSKQILKIVTQAVAKKIYGSIEVYFEAGRVTQVTQRIINKVRSRKQQKNEDVRIVRQKSSGNGHQDIENQNTLLTS